MVPGSAIAHRRRKPSRAMPIFSSTRTDALFSVSQVAQILCPVRLAMIENSLRGIDRVCAAMTRART